MSRHLAGLCACLLLLSAGSAEAHHGIASLGVAGLEGPGAPIEMSSSVTLPRHTLLISLKQDYARFERLIWQGAYVEKGAVSASADEGQLALGEIVASTVGDTSFSLEGMIDLERGSADRHSDESKPPVAVGECGRTAA